MTFIFIIESLAIGHSISSVEFSIVLIVVDAVVADADSSAVDDPSVGGPSVGGPSVGGPSGETQILFRKFVKFPIFPKVFFSTS